MADKIEVTTNKAIDDLVNTVEAAEVLAKTMDISTSEAMRMMLKSMQAVQMIQAGKTDKAFAALKSLIPKPQ